MRSVLQFFVVLVLSALALAIPTPTKKSNLKRTISGAVAAKCGENSFTEAEVETAASAAASRVAENSQVGKNKYPHQFNNREGFEFAPNCSSPFFEFPIFNSRVYTGGSPGPDRIVVGSLSNSDGVVCGLITHTGARGNGFTQCETPGSL